MAVPVPRTTAAAGHATEAVGLRDHPDGGRLEPHTGGDHPFATDPVGDGAGGELAQPPHGRIGDGQDHKEDTLTDLERLAEHR